jgi:glycine cleavage system H protein
MLYTEDHVWVRSLGAVVRVGITDFAQTELGDIAYVALPARGHRVRRGDVACTIDSLKSSSEIYAPVSGTIVEIHDALAGEHGGGAINADPYGEGWLLSIEMSDPAELGLLLSEADYNRLIEGA